MKNAILNLYAEFGRYINRFRAIPFYIDVLKPVERRLILSLYETAKNKPVKSAKVVGTAIAQYHPHGDLSSYQVLANLVTRKFAIGQGNWGNTKGVINSPPAAMRYTEVQLEPFITNLFEPTLKHVPWEALELDEEPLYLPSAIPLGLLGTDVITGISFYTTKIPQYAINSLKDRLYYLLTNTNKVIIEPNITNCKLTQVNGNDFETILTDGEGSLIITPDVVIENKSLYIIGKCPIYGFHKLKENADNLDINIIDHSKSNQTKVLIESKKRRNINDLYNFILPYISKTINFKCNVVDETGKVYQTGIDSILLNNYNKWKDSHLSLLNSQKILLINKKKEYEIIKVIRQILEQNPTFKLVDQIINCFELNFKTNNSNITSSEIKTVCSKHNIKSLIEYNNDINIIIQQIQQIQNSIDNIDNYCLSKLSMIC